MSMESAKTIGINFAGPKQNASKHAAAATRRNAIFSVVQALMEANEPSSGFAGSQTKKRRISCSVE